MAANIRTPQPVATRPTRPAVERPKSLPSIKVTAATPVSRRSIEVAYTYHPNSNALLSPSVRLRDRSSRRQPSISRRRSWFRRNELAIKWIAYLFAGFAVILIVIIIGALKGWDRFPGPPQANVSKEAISYHLCPVETEFADYGRVSFSPALQRAQEEALIHSLVLLDISTPQSRMRR